MLIFCTSFALYSDILTCDCRAVVPTQNNVIEAGQGMTLDNEKEWYYSVGTEKKGPVTFQQVNLCMANDMNLITCPNVRTKPSSIVVILGLYVFIFLV